MRKIWTAEPDSVSGEALDEAAYARHLQETLPTSKDREDLRKLTSEAE